MNDVWSKPSARSKLLLCHNHHHCASYWNQPPETYLDSPCISKQSNTNLLLGTCQHNILILLTSLAILLRSSVMESLSMKLWHCRSPATGWKIWQPRETVPNTKAYRTNYKCATWNKTDQGSCYRSERPTVLCPAVCGCARADRTMLASQVGCTGRRK